MAISARLSRTTHHTLGDEAGEDLVNWMIQVEANRSELRELMEAWAARTDGRFEAMDARFAEQRHWMEARFAEQQQRMDVGFAQVETRIERRFGDLLKWSFVFWCGAIGAVAALARVLR
jgi:hypothetical protein